MASPARGKGREKTTAKSPVSACRGPEAAHMTWALPAPALLSAVKLLMPITPPNQCQLFFFHHFYPFSAQPQSTETALQHCARPRRGLAHGGLPSSFTHCSHAEAVRGRWPARTWLLSTKGRDREKSVPHHLHRGTSGQRSDNKK